jgi:DNA-binding MarR family transcriptional regulator
MTKTLIEIQRAAEKRLSIHTLSTDYEIVYSLLDLSDISPDVLHRCTRLSSTAFYNKLKDLERAGAIISKVNPDDRRGRLYRINQSMRTMILNQQKGYMELFNTRVDEDAFEGQNLNMYRTYIHKGNIVNHLTADFQILLYLYLKSGISNLKISNVIDVSVTKFNSSLVKMVSLGLVRRDKDPADGRSKLYYLSDRSRNVLNDLHKLTFEWLEARS